MVTTLDQRLQAIFLVPGNVSSRIFGTSSSGADAENSHGFLIVTLSSGLASTAAQVSFAPICATLRAGDDDSIDSRKPNTSVIGPRVSTSERFNILLDLDMYVSTRLSMSIPPELTPGLK